MSEEDDEEKISSFREQLLASVSGIEGIKIDAALSNRDVLRFLRARSWDNANAIEMARAWYTWYFEAPLRWPDSLRKRLIREAEGEEAVAALESMDPCLHPITGEKLTPSTLLEYEFEEEEEIMRQYCPHSNLSEDKEGCPIYFELTGEISNSFDQVLVEASADDLILRHIKQMEMAMLRLEACSKAHGKRIEKFSVISDLGKLAFNLNPTALTTFLKTVSIDKSYYPERLKNLFFINTPWYFSTLWTIAYPFLDAVTVQKVVILGQDYLPTLCLHIDEDMLPESHGGTRKDYQWVYPGNWPHAHDAPLPLARNAKAHEALEAATVSSSTTSSTQTSSRSSSTTNEEEEAAAAALVKIQDENTREEQGTQVHPFWWLGIK